MAERDQEPTASSLTCFVIGPIGDRHAAMGTPERTRFEEAVRIMAEVVEPACRRFGLEPVRADSLTRAGEITEQIFRRLRDDNIVIADLTGANPNVMYELGLRHTRDKLTVQIGEYGQLPFDVNVIRTIQFSRSDNGLIRARDELIALLDAGLREDFDPVTATRIWHEDPRSASDETATTAGTPTTPEVPEGEDDRGFVDILAEYEEALEEIIEALADIGRCVERAGRLAEQSAAETSKSDAGGKGMRGRLQILTRYATGLNEIAEELEPATERYLSLYQHTIDGMDVLVTRMEQDPDERAAGKDFAMLLRQNAAGTRESMSSTASLAANIRENASFSKVLRSPSVRLTKQLDRLVDSAQRMDELDRRLQVLRIPVPPEGWQPELPEADTITDPGSNAIRPR